MDEDEQHQAEREDLGDTYEYAEDGHMVYVKDGWESDTPW